MDKWTDRKTDRVRGTHHLSDGDNEKQSIYRDPENVKRQKSEMVTESQ